MVKMSRGPHNRNLVATVHAAYPSLVAIPFCIHYQSKELIIKVYNLSYTEFVSF